MRGLVLGADAVGHVALLAAEAVEPGDDLRALPRQLVERGAERLLQLRLGVRVGGGDKLADSGLNVGDRHAPLRHLRGEAGDRRGRRARRLSAASIGGPSHTEASGNSATLG